MNSNAAGSLNLISTVNKCQFYDNKHGGFVNSRGFQTMPFYLPDAQ